MDKSNDEANGATNIRTLWWKQANIIKWKQAYSFYFIKVIKFVLKLLIIEEFSHVQTFLQIHICQNSIWRVAL